LIQGTGARLHVDQTRESILTHPYPGKGLNE
jgi:hypothetical protein